VIATVIDRTTMFPFQNTRSKLGKRKKRNVEPIKQLQLGSSKIVPKKKGIRKKLVKSAAYIKNLCKPKTKKGPEGKLSEAPNLDIFGQPQPGPSNLIIENEYLSDGCFIGFDANTETALSRIKLFYFKAVVERFAGQSDNVETSSGENAVTQLFNNHLQSNCEERIQSCSSKASERHNIVISDIQETKVENDVYSCTYAREPKNTIANKGLFGKCDTEPSENPSLPYLKIHDSETYDDTPSEMSLNKLYVLDERKLSCSSVDRPLEYTANDSDEDRGSLTYQSSSSEGKLEETMSEDTTVNEQRTAECSQFNFLDRNTHYIPFIKDEGKHKEENESQLSSAQNDAPQETPSSGETVVDEKKADDLKESTVKVSKMKLFLVPRVLRNPMSYKFKDEPSLEISGPIKDGDYNRYAFKRKATYKKREFVIGGYKLTADQQKLVYLFSQTFNWQYTQCINNEVTHLVWEERKTSPKYYMAIANCTLLIKFEWIVKCLQYNQVFSPAPYLIPGKGVASCMISYRPQLFIRYIACIADTQKETAADLLKQVFTCCGGTIVERETMFKHPDWPKPKLLFYFGDSPSMISFDEILKRNHILPIHYVWIFESLGNYKLSSFQNYIHPSYAKYFEDDIIEKVVID